VRRGTWKARERDLADRMGGRRIPVTGIDRHGADVVTPMFHIQSKHGRSRPGYLRDWLSGICGTAKDAGKIGIVVWSAMREDGDDAIVLMRLRDFQDLHGKTEETR
jgi:hypothetical protein